MKCKKKLDAGTFNKETNQNINIPISINMYRFQMWPEDPLVWLVSDWTHICGTINIHGSSVVPGSVLEGTSLYSSGK